MKLVTLTDSKQHLYCLTNEDVKEEFISGITSILRGEKPKHSCSFMGDVFHNLANGSDITISGSPKFDPTGMGKADRDRYNKVQAGKVPSFGLGDKYSDLVFKPIKTLDKDYVEELCADCLSRINRKQGSTEYRKFLRYLADMLKHCLDSGEL